MLFIFALLLNLLTLSWASQYAICAQVGCLVTDQPLLAAVGVQLQPLTSSTVDSVLLLTGSFTSDLPTLSGEQKLLEAFLGDDAKVSEAQGFQVANKSSSALNVALDDATSMLAFGNTLYAGTPNGNKIQSYIVRPGASAYLQVIDGGPVDHVQVHESAPDVNLLGMGSGVTFELASDTSKYKSCEKNQYSHGQDCLPCPATCTSCYSATGCLSCASNARLVAGQCRPARCAGGATLLAHLNVCLEELVPFEDFVAKKPAKAITKAAIVIPTVLSGVIIIILSVCLWRKRRKSHKDNLLGDLYDMQHPLWSAAPTTANSASQDWPLSSAQFMHKRQNSQSSGYPYSHEDEIYSVPPESEDGPAPDDDWAMHQRALQRRKEKELMRLREEIRLGRGDDASSVNQSRRDADERSVGDTTENYGYRRTFSPQHAQQFKKGHSRKGSMDKQESLKGDNTDASSRFNHWRRDVILKRPDPVKPASTIFTKAPPKTPGATSSQEVPHTSKSSSFGRIAEWASTPKEEIEMAQTVVSLSPSKIAKHSRKPSGDSHRSGKKRTAASTVSPSSHTSPSLAPTSVSRNGPVLAKRRHVAASEHPTNIPVNVDGMTALI